MLKISKPVRNCQRLDTSFIFEETQMRRISKPRRDIFGWLLLDNAFGEIERCAFVGLELANNWS
jgi:hypothetical protein